MILNYILVFLFGAIIGSFLNVVIVRYDQGDFFGRSKCPKCFAPLLWFELIPILSFFFARGRCRHCGQPISWQYPIVEALTGLVFVSVFWKYNFASPDIFNIIISLIFFSLLIILAVYDFYHQEIPNLVYGVILLSLLVLFFDFSWLRLLAGPVLALPFAFLYFISKGKLIGFGDAKLILALGWFLGLMAGLAAIFLAFWIGAIAAIILLLFYPQKFKMKTALPFAPFLVLASWLVFVFNLDFFWLVKIFT